MLLKYFINLNLIEQKQLTFCIDSIKEFAFTFPSFPFIFITNFPVIVLCCIFRCRIPRTKAEIEANAKRKSLLKNFNQKLGQLKAAELDDMDYRNGKYTLFSKVG